MRSNMIFNPFTRLAGWSALLIGVVGLSLTVALSYLTGTHFFGLLMVGFAKNSPLWVYAVELVAHWLVMSAVAYVTGLVLSKVRIRAIDVLGTILMSKLPLLILPLIRLLQPFQSFSFLSFQMFFLVIIYLTLLVYICILIYNALSVSFNLKGKRLVIAYISSLVLTEIAVLYLNLVLI